MGRKKVQPRDYFCTFDSFELKLYGIAELCIPKNPKFVVFFILTGFGGKMTSQG